MERAHDLGATHFGTAELYSWSANEVLGRAVANFSKEIILATKFGFVRDDGSRPEHIREVVDNSLHHLGVESIGICIRTGSIQGGQLET